MTARSRDSRRTVWGAGAVLVLLMVVVLFGSFAGSRARDFVSNLSAGTASSSPYASLSRDELASRLADDERQLALVRYQSVLYSLLSDENKKLRNILDAAPAPGSVVARVLSRPPRTLYDTLIVDRGSSGGVSENDLVLYGGVALGRVVSVGVESALVQLFSSPGAETDAIVGKPAAIVIAEGKGGGAFEVAVPQGVSVAPGDSVRMPATESLVLGVVAGVSSKPSDSFQTVLVRSPLSLSDLDFVEILPNRNP